MTYPEHSARSVRRNSYRRLPPITLSNWILRWRAAVMSARDVDASNDFESVRKGASEHGYVGYELDARLALADLALREAKPYAASTLETIEREAKVKVLA